MKWSTWTLYVLVNKDYRSKPNRARYFEPLRTFHTVCLQTKKTKRQLQNPYHSKQVILRPTTENIIITFHN